MVVGTRFCDVVIGRPLETAHRQAAGWRRRDGVPSRDFERRAPKNLETTLGASRAIASGFRDSNQQHSADETKATAKLLWKRAFQAARLSCGAADCTAHDDVPGEFGRGA